MMGGVGVHFLGCNSRQEGERGRRFGRVYRVCAGNSFLSEGARGSIWHLKKGDEIGSGQCCWKGS